MLGHYFHTALRNFARFKLSTGINVLCLTVGLMCFLAAMGVARYIQSSDRQWKNADRTFVITERLMSPARGFDTGVVPWTSPPIARHLQEDIPGLEAVARIEDLDDPLTVVSSDGTKASAYVAGAEADLLRIFDLPFKIGRAVNALDEPGSIVLSLDLAAKLFGNRPALGERVLLENSVEVTVTGVLAPISQPSQFGDSTSNAVRFEALISLDVLHDLTRKARGRSRDEDPATSQWGSVPFITYVLLPKDGSVSREFLSSRLDGFAERHAPAERLAAATYQFGAVPVSTVWAAMLDNQVMRGTGISIVVVLKLLGSVVLFMSCLNYANSATAQAMARMKEAGLRKVLGGSRRQIAFQYIFEAALLTTTALAISIAALKAAAPLLASFSVHVALFPPGPLSVVAFAILIISAVSVAGGLYPGVVLARIRPAESLQWGKTRQGNAFVAKILVSMQFGAASLLLIGATVVYLQNAQLRRNAISASSDPVVVIGNDLRISKVNFDSLRNELLSNPDIKAVGMMGELPWVNGWGTLSLTRSLESDAKEISPVFNIVTEDSLATLGIEIVAGRSFDREHADDVMPTTNFRALDTGRTYAIVIDSAAAEQLGWRTPAEAIDQLAYIPFSHFGMGQDQPVRIIGVAQTKPLLLTAPASGISSTMYIQLPPGMGYPIVRISRENIPATLRAIDSAWNGLAPNFSVNRRFLDELFEQAYITYERINHMVAGLAFAAFAVAAMGLFGMASFVASRRIHEVGVRKTLGATSSQIVSLLLRDFSKPVVIANLAAWPLAYFAAQSYLANFLSRISLTPTPFIVSFLITLLIAWIAVSSQTLRAARLNPGTVLRYE